MSSIVRFGTAGGADPFEKVRGLITDMISQLVAEAEAEAQHKAYCDKQVTATDAQQEDAKAEFDSLTSKTNQKEARSVKTREHISTLQKELASISRSQAEAAALRQEEETVFKKDKGEMQRAVNGIRLALRILKEHYGTDAADNAAGIISLLEIVESDFTQALTGLIVDEEQKANYYKTEVKQNFELETAAKEHDMKYKMKQYMSMNKAVAELSGDLNGVESRLSAINEFDKTIKKTCGPQPNSYDERKKRRDSEIDGLKEALEILEGTSLLELGSSHKLRGARHSSA